jgi:EmrB/QacA subfamily drug resistance transporter
LKSGQRESVGGDADGRGRALVVACLAGFVAFLDVTIVNVAFPSIEDDFAGTPLTTLSWVLNGYNVVFAALLVPAGRYADALGHRRALMFGMAGFTAASVLAGAASSAWLLIAARVLQAVAAAVLVPASLAVLLDRFPVDRRATAVGLWGAAAAVAAALGPSVGGALVSVSDWRLVFFVNVPLGLAACWLAAALPRRGVVAAPFPDPLGIVLVAGAMGALALGIVQGEEWGWSSAGTAAAFASAVILAVAFSVRSRRVATPALELSLFGERTFGLANMGTLLFAAGFYGLLLNNVLFLTEVWGYSTFEAGLALTPGPLVAAAAAGPAGRVADRFGQRVVVIPGLVSMIAGVAYLAQRAGVEPSYATTFLPAAALSGLGIGLALPALGSAAVGALEAARFATGSAVNAAARQVGAVLGIAVVVAVLSGVAAAERVDAYERNWWLVAVATAAVVPLAAALRPTSPAGAQWTDVAATGSVR